MGTIRDEFGFEPPAAFYFTVRLIPNKPLIGALIADTSFMEVSGISAKLETESYKEGGNNNTAYNLPTGIKYDNLLLKRGLTPLYSSFAVWCEKNLLLRGGQEVITGTLIVSLLDKIGLPQCIWIFLNAYPVKWNVDQLGSKKNELAIETIECCYSSFVRGL